jgi:hypothetical protein
MNSDHQPTKGQVQNLYKLTHPLAIKSDREITAGKYKRKNLLAGAILSLAVSSTFPYVWRQ